MKKIKFLIIAASICFSASAQMESGIYATGAVGVQTNGQAIVSTGLHGNINNFYSGINVTPAVDGSVLYEARAGVIMGRSICAVPYVGYGMEIAPKEFDENGTKFSTAAPSRGLSYGLLLTAPTAWDKTRFVFAIQSFGGKASVSAGFKVQLTNFAPCY